MIFAFGYEASGAVDTGSIIYNPSGGSSSSVSDSGSGSGLDSDLQRELGRKPSYSTSSREFEMFVRVHRIHGTRRVAFDFNSPSFNVHSSNLDWGAGS